MNMLSDYQRMIEAPQIEAYEQTIAGLRAQLAERDAQLAAADKLLKRARDATSGVIRHDSLRRDIHAYLRTRQPNKESE